MRFRSISDLDFDALQRRNQSADFAADVRGLDETLRGWHHFREQAHELVDGREPWLPASAADARRGVDEAQVHLRRRLPCPIKRRDHGAANEIDEVRFLIAAE